MLLRIVQAVDAAAAAAAGGMVVRGGMSRSQMSLDSSESTKAPPGFFIEQALYVYVKLLVYEALSY
jgi:hypothetical protein